MAKLKLENPAAIEVIAAEEKVAADKKAAGEKAKAEKDPYKALVAEYKKAYPKNKELHITSDGQVFLAGDKNLAQMHQRTLEGGEVKTYKTE